MEATIGFRAANNLGLSIGDEFVGGHGMEDEVLHHHDEYKYKVVGILKKSGSVLDNLILTPVETVWIMHAGHDEDSDYTIGSGEKKKKQDIHEEHAEEHHNHHGHDHHDHHRYFFLEICVFPNHLCPLNEQP